MEHIDVKIKAGKESSYPILIDENLLDDVYDFIKACTNAKKFLVVTNTKVNSLYGEKLKAENAEFIILPDGEQYKNREILNTIIDKAMQMKLERKDAIIALGGGVIGDIAGFAASVYMRGIDFIQVPTTLLAQVDSSVGGKVAINHKLGKNVIGSFYQPKLVLADTNTLYTLDDRQFKTGLAEVLKYAFIEKSCNADKDYNLFKFLKNGRDKILKKDSSTLKELIKICCLLKSSVVNKDEKESGLRAVLNFGHTYAHAIENITDYCLYTHGEAVSIGMKMVFDLAEKINFISEEYYHSAVNLINDYGLTTKFDLHLCEETFYEAMLSDKKVKDNKINFVMPVDNYEVQIVDNIDKKLFLQGIIYT
ncbi:MAG: 3-dehydroquinate synthase [Candidatus Gastranaerophilales bacterium]|nr:3-dehydroquinate synthase [Candidatus Gastranaerophilales bacterium]